MKKILTLGLVLALLLGIGMYKTHKDEVENRLSIMETIRENRGIITSIESVNNQSQE